MARSMTGFARIESAGDAPTLEVAIRSVNHRFLDLKIRTPPELEGSDARIRKLVKKRVGRGGLQINVGLRGEDAAKLQLNQEVVDAYLKAHEELAKRLGVVEPPDIAAMLRVPGVLAEGAADEDVDREALAEKLEETLGRALDALNEERAREGEGLEREVRERTAAIVAEAEKVTGEIPGLAAAFRERLESRLADLLEKVDPDPQRVLQETAILAERADVSEELQRLQAHAKRVIELMDSGGEVGKQLDFLAQELNREANTLLSKTNSLGAAALQVTEAGLRLKAEIEKIREQAQNLE